MLAAVATMPALPRQARATPRPRQDCARCRSLGACWDRRLDSYGIAVNLLVCRLRQNIERDRSTRLLCRMLEPKLIQVAQTVVGQVGSTVSVRELVLEQQSVMVESLLTQYVLGDFLHPLHWLFGNPNGAITRWALHYIRVAVREAQTTYHYDSSPLRAGIGGWEPGHSSDFEDRLTQVNHAASGNRVSQGPPDLAENAVEYDETAQEHERGAAILDVVDDGVTLSLAEYRIVAFCLANAREDSGQPIAGLHQAMARRMRLRRKAVTRLYGLGIRRLLDAYGETSQYFRRKGLKIPKTAHARRRARQLRLPVADSMNANEIADMLELRRQARVSVQDIAWMFGVCEDFVYRLCRRFRGLPREEIRAICSGR